MGWGRGGGRYKRGRRMGVTRLVPWKRSGKEKEEGV